MFRLCRYAYKGVVAYGVVEDELVYRLEGDIFNHWTRGRAIANLNEVTLLAPVQPGKVIAVGVNYRDHAQEMKHDLPENPIIFIKPASAVVGPEALVEYPSISQRLDYEGELAVIIGRRSRFISRENAADHILGYACANDITARDFQLKDGQWTRGKSFDTFCPLGPFIVGGTDFDPGNLRLQTRVNGVIRQEANTELLIFDIPGLCQFISQIMTLEPGDVIITGTPEGVGPMNIGDTVEVEIEHLGILSNTIVAG